MKLSIVDQSPVPAGLTAADALRNTIELARLADQLGYHRYWIAEHHATAAFASPAPEIMIARVAAETSSIRVGSGGVMLPHYSPMKVVEQFKVLHALYPDRIDLGLGRAPGGSPLDSFALRRDRDHQPTEDDFPRQLMELLAFLNHGFRPDHPFSRIELSPELPGGPEVWMLGSSMWSAAAAAQVGLPYSFAHFIDPVPTRSAIEYYRTHFKPSDRLDHPRVVLSLGAIAADTEEEAKRLFSSVRVFGRRIRQGIRTQIPSVEEATQELADANKSGPDRPDNGEWPRIFIGDAENVRDRLIDMASVLGAEEIMIVTITHDHRARLHSYRLLAKAFGLAPRIRPAPIQPS
ncbi:MAG: LLM class flavin-dependent oxidoreductase [Candidatus Binataceae bacterium]